MRAYIDDDKTAMQLSSGLEDYFLGTYYFNRGPYANGLAGLTHFDTKNNLSRPTVSMTRILWCSKTVCA